jgi:hypothetical protein
MAARVELLLKVVQGCREIPTALTKIALKRLMISFYGK